MMWKEIAIAALTCLISSSVRALDPARAISQYAHTAWRNRDGYFASAPSVVAQTQDGYIWIGTNTGLLRFDGVRFAPWEPPKGGPTLPSANVLVLLPSKDGSLWIGTAQGLARWYNGVLTNYPSGSVRIDSIQEDQEGHIWIARTRVHDGTGPLCEVVDSELRCYGRSDSIPEAQGTSLAIDSSGTFWIGGEGGLTRWAPHSAQTFHPLNRQRNVHTQISALEANRDGGLWVGFFGSGHGLGLQRFEKGVWQPVTIGRFHGASLQVDSLFIDSTNSLWVGTKSAGIYRIHRNVVEHFDASDGLSGDAVQGFFEDEEHNIWVATYTGIDCFRDLPVVSYTKREGLTADEVNSVYAAEDGTVWVGIVGGLDSIRDGAVSHIRTGKALPGSEVTTMLVDHTARLWLGVDDSLYLYEQGRFQPILDTKGRRSGMVTDLAEDVDGGIWATEQDPGAHQLLHIRGHVISEQFPEKQVIGVVADPHGGVWSNLFESIAHRQNGVEKVLKIPPQFHIDYFSDMVTDRQGAIWAVFQQGVLRLQGEQAQLLGVSNGLPCASHGSLIFDRRGSLWLILRCGIVRIDQKSLQDWIEHPETKVSILFLDLFDGVQIGATDFRPSVSLGKDGRLWLVNGSDVQMLDPEQLHINTFPPPVHIERLIADHKGTEVTPDARLPALTRDIEIDYTGLSFVMPQRVRFRYKLEGHDRNWQEAGTRREAFYTNLPPGSYRFRVIASNNDGVWNETGAQLAFIIPPSFTQGIWFKAICSLAFVGFVYATYRLRVRRVTGQLRGRMYERLAERERIARDLHDTFFQGIQGLLLRFHTATSQLHKDEPARRILEETLRQSDQVMLEGRELVLDLRATVSEPTDLPTAFANFGEEMRKGGSCDFRVVVNGSICPLHPVVFEELFKIGKEALGNAFRHSAAHSIEAELNYKRSELRVRIRDDGTGIDPAILRQGHRDGHFGLPGMRERAQKVGAQLDVWSRPGAGTEVELRIAGGVAYISEPNGSGLRTLWRWWRATKQESAPDEKENAST